MLKTIDMPKIYQKAERITQCIIHWLVVPIIATSMIMWPTYSSGLETLNPDPGDTLLNAYLLEHAFQHLTSLRIFSPEKFWSPSFFWPIKNTLAWSDHLLGQSIIYGIFRTILNPINAYVCWLSATLILNYISIRRALQKISPNTKVIWLSIATLTTAFSPAITLQIGHPQLLSLFIIGPILYECHRLLTEKSENYTVGDWIYTACLLLMNGFFNIYIFVYGCFGVIICTGIHFFRRVINHSMRLRIGNNLIQKSSILMITSSINLYIYWPYLQTLNTFGERPIETIINNLPKPAGWLLGKNWLLLPPPWNHQTINPDWISGQEQALFPGWGLMVLLSAAVLTLCRKERNEGMQNWLIAITLMILLTMSFNGENGWLVVMKLLPGSGSLRASSRVAMMIILFSAPSIALAAKSWKWELKDFWNITCEIFALSASFTSIWMISGKQYQFSYKNWEKELIAVSNALQKKDCDVFWYEWTEERPRPRPHILAMHAQLRTGIPTANGYSGQFPNSEWPFTNPSGQNAFRWLSGELSQTSHSKHDTLLFKKKCILKLNENKIASIKYYEQKPSSTPIIILTREHIKIGDDGERLYISVKSNIHTSCTEWLELKRAGRPIPADRGDYQITDARIKNGLLLITDKNLVARDQYIWKVNPKTGVFLNQTYTSLKY